MNDGSSDGMTSSVRLAEHGCEGQDKNHIAGLISPQASDRGENAMEAALLEEKELERERIRMAIDAGYLSPSWYFDVEVDAPQSCQSLASKTPSS